MNAPGNDSSHWAWYLSQQKINPLISEEHILSDLIVNSPVASDKLEPMSLSILIHIEIEPVERNGFTRMVSKHLINMAVLTWRCNAESRDAAVPIQDRDSDVNWCTLEEPVYGILWVACPSRFRYLVKTRFTISLNNGISINHRTGWNWKRKNPW